jgi:hypothetical protein
VRIYELLGQTGQLAPGEVELTNEFGKGLAAYRAREWDAAERQFQRCLEVKPADGPSVLYIERITELRKQPPGRSSRISSSCLAEKLDPDEGHACGVLICVRLSPRRSR